MNFKTTYKNSHLIYVLFLLGMGMLTSSEALAQERELKWYPFEKAFEIAERQGKPILVDVWAPWCGWCKKMYKEVYPELSTKMSNSFVLTRLNRDDNETKNKFGNLSLTPLRLAQKLGVQSVPSIVFLSSKGKYEFHISGFMNTQKLELVLEYADSSMKNQRKAIGGQK